MKINKKIIKTFLFIIGVMWLGNIIFYNSKKIDGPIFTYTYNNGKNRCELSYLMDQDDKDKVETIILPEANNFELIVPQDENFDFPLGLNINESIEDRNSDGSIRYNIYNIDLFTSTNSEGVQLGSNKEEFNITKIKYRTVNGKEGECEIGRIIHKEELSLEKYLDRPYHLFSNYEKSSSSDGEERTIFRALDNIEIIGIEGEFKNALFEYCEMKINGQEISEESFPIKISSGKDIDVSIQYCENSAFYEKYNSCSFKLIARDPEGTEEEMDIDLSILNDNITFKGVDNLLEKRGLK